MRKNHSVIVGTYIHAFEDLTEHDMLAIEPLVCIQYEDDVMTVKKERKTPTLVVTVVMKNCQNENQYSHSHIKPSSHPSR